MDFLVQKQNLSYHKIQSNKVRRSNKMWIIKLNFRESDYVRGVGVAYPVGLEIDLWF